MMRRSFIPGHKTGGGFSLLPHTLEIVQNHDELICIQSKLLATCPHLPSVHAYTIVRRVLGWR